MRHLNAFLTLLAVVLSLGTTRAQPTKTLTGQVVSDLMLEGVPGANIYARDTTVVGTTDMEGYLAVVKNPNGVLLLDVREEAEFKVGHVPGAVNIPRGLLEFRIWKQLGFPSNVDMSRKIYVQCQTGGRATLATKQLQDIGFTDVTAVIMNFEEWQKKGNPLSKG